MCLNQFEYKICSHTHGFPVCVTLCSKWHSFLLFTKQPRIISLSVCGQLIFCVFFPLHLIRFNLNHNRAGDCIKRGCSIFCGPICQSLPVNLITDLQEQKRHHQPQNLYNKNNLQSVFPANGHFQSGVPDQESAQLHF